MRRIQVAFVAVVLVVLVGCAAKYRTVMAPPRVDLSEHEVIAVVEFDSRNAAELAPLATRRFTDLARRDQGLVRMLSVGHESGARDASALRELGQRHGAQTLFIGKLDVSDIHPDLNLSGTLRSGSLTANVDATLTVELVETETGASIWSASASASRTVGHVSVFDGKHVTFDAEDPDKAYGPLIDALVGQVTTDFQNRWVRQPVSR
jgi:hypothetical protein